MDYKEITAVAVSQADLRHIVLVDVRTQGEFAQRRLVLPAALAPLADLEPSAFALQHGILQDTPLVVVCNSGDRAKKGAEKFLKAGFTDVQIMQGGLSAWAQAGLPLIDKLPAQNTGAPITIERQVRILAGFIVFVFVLLGWIAHPAFAAIALFIGAGLTYSGISNSCGMAYVLALAPWNRASCSGGACPLDGKPKGSPGASCQ